uniref:GRANULINS domain-containing protein n=1 Tax=Macrostomum lignano TaxID=282301 RepID=A0A1I8FQX1_9PLAT
MLPPLGGGPDIRVTSPCLSNEERVYFPDEVSRLPELAKPIKKVETVRCPMRISVWIECSPGFYGRGCDVRCEPQRGCCCDSEGLLRCDETIDCSAQLATKPAFPTADRSGAGDQAMAIPTIETEMKLNALIISRLVSQDASVSSVDADSTVLNLRRQQNHYQLQHQNLGYFNPASLQHSHLPGAAKLVTPVRDAAAARRQRGRLAN